MELNEILDLLESDDGRLLFVSKFDDIIASDHLAFLMRKDEVLKIIVEYDLFGEEISSIASVYGYNVISFYRMLQKLYNYDKNYFLEKVPIWILCGVYDENLLDLVFCFLEVIDYDMDSLIGYFQRNDVGAGYNYKFFNSLLNFSNGKEIILKYFSYFVSWCDGLIKFKSLLDLSSLSSEQLNELNEAIDSDVENVIGEIMMDSIYCTLDELEDEEILLFLKTIIDELINGNDSKINYHDINYLSGGAYSSAYQFGDFVLKIGIKRKMFYMKDNKRFLKPLLRKEINLKDNSDVLFCIEITQMVDTNDITEEDVYQIYKELRDQGLYWTDAKCDNLGRLRKSNKVHFPGIDCVSHEASGYLDYCDEVLPAGELVILDNDYIWTTNKINGMSAEMYGDFMELEERYQRELASKKR